jgi:hypothetical protein
MKRAQEMTTEIMRCIHNRMFVQNARRSFVWPVDEPDETHDGFVFRDHEGTEWGVEVTRQPIRKTNP